MSEWKNFCLGDVVEFNPAEKIVKGTLAKKIAMEKLQPFCRTVTGYEVEKYNGGVKFRNGDTIMARITPCLENGKTARIDVLDDDEIGFGSTEYVVFRAKENVTVPDFVYYLIRSEVVREPAIKSMVGTSGRQRVQTDYVRNIVINLPPLETQKKIATVLSALDDKIELNNAINRNLEEQAQAIFKSWFIDFEPFGGTMPDDWEFKNLGNVTDNIRERITNFNTPVFSAVNTGRLVLSDEFFYKRVYSKGIKKYLLVREGDFAYNPARINIGSIGLNDFGYEGCVSPVYVVVRVNANYRAFFRFYFKTKTFAEECLSRGSGSVRQSLNYDDFSLIEMIYPSNEYARKFNELWENYFFVIQNISCENQKLGELRDALLPCLMSGEIDVSEVEI